MTTTPPATTASPSPTDPTGPAVPAPPPSTSGRRQALIALIVVVLLAIGAGLWWWAEHREGTKFIGVFSASVGVYPGSDVRELGVAVGRVDSVTPDGTTVRIGMHLNPGVHATPDTKAVIISPNLVSDRYVQLTGVYTSGPTLQSGAVIPESRTATPVELDDLYRSLVKLSSALGPKGANSNGAFSNLLNTGARNLGGNGRTINNTITQLSQATSTLSGSRTQIFGTLQHLASFTGMLKDNNDNLIKVNDELSSVTGTLADDRQSFAEAMHQLASALSLVQTFVHDNRDALSSNVSKLSRVARTLAQQQNSLNQALRAAPLLTQNFQNAYDKQDNVLRGRVNLNEISLWSQTQGGGS